MELALYAKGDLRQRASAGLMIWPPDEILDQARTLVLTGTPEGVAFQLPNLWNPGAYLRPGDEVVGTGTHLGVLANRVDEFVTRAVR